ncbi:unnamed protein product [Rhodiola kirilowii]
MSILSRPAGEVLSFVESDSLTGVPLLIDLDKLTLGSILVLSEG